MPTNLSPAGSAARMLRTGSNIRGECLVAVGAAILHGKAVLDHAATAADAYSDAGKAHQHATHAPADFPMFFSGAGGQGDVVISVGDGVNCIASDYTDAKGKIHWGVIGEMTIAARARQVGGKLLGWTDLFLGYTLSNLDPSGGNTSPVFMPRKGFIMMAIQSSTSRLFYLLEGPYIKEVSEAEATLQCTLNQPPSEQNGSTVDTIRVLDDADFQGALWNHGFGLLADVVAATAGNRVCVAPWAQPASLSLTESDLAAIAKAISVSSLTADAIAAAVASAEKADFDAIAKAIGGLPNAAAFVKALGASISNG